MKHRIAIWLAALTLLSFQPPARVRIFMIGDSTMANKTRLALPERGWGQVFGEYFDSEVEIHNHAVNGRSSKSFLREGRWDSVMKQLRPGDWVLIQFGHNDSKIKDTNRYAAPHTDYKYNLTRFVREARSKGAHPVLLTPVNRRQFNEKGEFEDTHGDYPGVVRELAGDLQVPLIDLHKSSGALIKSMGEKESVKLFQTTPPGYYAGLPDGITDNTHFSLYGARIIAGLVAKEIHEKSLGLSSYLRRTPFAGKYTFDIPVVYEPHFRLDTFNIKNYGAVPDGHTLNSDAINTAIRDCNAHGGGVVLIPAGFWLTGPIVLRDSVNLHLDRNALLQFSPDFKLYHLVAGNWEGFPSARNQSPISATDASNIAITGHGVIDGSGNAWRMVKKDKLTESQWKKLSSSGGVLSADKKTWYPSEESLLGSKTKNAGILLNGKTVGDFESIKDFLRPNLLVLVHCHNILLQGVTFQNSPAWNLHPLMCTDLTVRGVYARNPWYAQNGDGIDIESCNRVLVENCLFDVGDDGICVKSGRDAEGRKRGMPTENLIVRHCKVYHAHGGFVIGSEMSGGARNLYVSDCSFIGTDIGLRFKTTRGRGGLVEKVFVADINMKDIVGDAIRFDMYYAAKDPLPLAGETRKAPELISLPVDETTPRFRDFQISRVVCDGAARGIFIRGLPEMNIKNIRMDNLTLYCRIGMECTEADGLSLRNVRIMPADADPVIHIDNSRRIVLDQIRYPPQSTVFLHITGKGSEDIRVQNTDLSSTLQKVRFGVGASPGALTLQ